MNDPQGSLWRRWDLHVHTPASALNNQFGGDWDRYVHALFCGAISRNIAVVGVTDYYTVEGFRKLHDEYLAKHDALERVFAAELALDPSYLKRVREVTIFANIEFRLDVAIEKGGTKKLNMHVLFAEDVSAKQIEDNFLSQLAFTIQGIPQGPD
ncbi:MAG TPA: hypothetical protein VHX14_12355, partial [Thermoanaerobaculia bacterium]|nr:hypothetical protein [Thermoanaerobaculia bacterium]